MTTAKREFKQLLKEVKIITYKSKGMIQESKKHLKDITEVLKVGKFIAADSWEGGGG